MKMGKLICSDTKKSVLHGVSRWRRMGNNLKGKKQNNTRIGCDFDTL